MDSANTQNGTSQQGPIVPSQNQTLYVHNLNDKVKKDDLRRCLYMLFATYGRVIQIVALKTSKMRGQAHVVFTDTDSAADALRSLQGTMFFDKPLQIEYAKSKSRVVALAEFQELGHQPVADDMGEDIPTYDAYSSSSDEDGDGNNKNGDVKIGVKRRLNH